eukprot:539344_1
MLLIDQYLHRSSTKNYVNDNEMNVDYLLHTLIIYTDRIIDASAFWIQIGFVVSEELIPIIKDRKLSEITKYTEKGNAKTLLHRLAEELHIKEFLKEYADHLLQTLKTSTQKIADASVFWSQIGFNWTDALLPIIKQHSLLQNTTYKEKGNVKTLLHRLVEELKISCLLNEYRILTSHNFEIKEHGLLNFCNVKIKINNT